MNGPEPGAVITGTLHVYVAYDWGDEIDLLKALRLVPAEVHELPRRPRTPASIAYRPPPLRLPLPSVTLTLGGAAVTATAEATVFDFAGVSVALHVPIRSTRLELPRLAGTLTDAAPFLQAAKQAVEPFHARLLPAITDPLWEDNQSEEYFVFQLPPGSAPPDDPGWLAGMVRLEPGRLSTEEVAEALRLRLSYSPDDLFVPDWAAAILFDTECNETLQVIEFANLQLLEYRHIDGRLEHNTAAAYRTVRQAGQSRLPFLRSHDSSLRALGELKLEANDLFERTGNVLKLVGDQYLARVYGLLARRFHLREWESSIRLKLEVAEGVYAVAAQQAAARRTEFLEIVVIILIALEIVLALVRN